MIALPYSKFHQGSSLIYILILSLAVSLILLGTLQAISVSRQDNLDRYYNKLAEEASEAGTAYAQSCLSKDSNPNRSQTWTLGNLTPKTSCNGATVGTNPTYVMDDGVIRTTFSVANLEVSTNFSAIIISTGRVYVGDPANPATKSYQVALKKTITWDPSLVIKKVASGVTRVCAIITDQAWCWGQNHYGQLGDGTSSSAGSLVPKKVVGLEGKKVIDIAAGSYITCAITDEGGPAPNHVYCWGRNSNGTLPSGSPLPTMGEIGNNYVRDPVSCNNAAAAAQPPRPNTEPESYCVRSPYEITTMGSLSGKQIQRLWIGNVSAYALDSNGNVHSWGYNGNGQLGNGTTTASPVPIQVPGLDKVVDLGAGPRGSNVCALRRAPPTSDQIYCWGSNWTYASGNSAAPSNVLSPLLISPGAIPPGTSFVDIEADGWSGLTSDPNSGLFEGHVCALATNGTVYCWGSNNRGQLGDGSPVSTYYSTVPVQVANTTPSTSMTSPVTQIALTGPTSCALTTDKRAYCWGSNQNGSLANPTKPLGAWTPSCPAASCYIARTPEPIDTTPTNPILNVDIDSIAGGAARTCAAARGRSYCWGGNSWGQIGDGTTVNRASPTEALFLRPKNNQFIF